MDSGRRLAIACALICAYMLAEVIGGWLAHSLALLADAGHMLSDAAALGLALFAARFARRPRSRARTWGYRRVEVLAASVNGVTLVLIAAWIVREAIGRLRDPGQVNGPLMLAVAAGGLVVNLAAMAVLHGGRGESINVRAAWLHVLADALGSAQAVVAGGLIWAFGWMWVDPVAAVIIALLIVGSAFALLRESGNILLEGSPSRARTGEIEQELSALDHVRDVHDVHLWTISSGFHAFSAHLVIGEGDHDEVLARARRLLRERFDLEHVTLQVERDPSCGPGNCDA